MSLLRRTFEAALWRYYGWYTLGFLAFVGLLALGEQRGLPRVWIGYLFLLTTIGTYAAIGMMSRTADENEYYVAGRRVPALFNGMATAADWMSAASFIGLAGTLYLTGYSGLAYVMGWTGGFCLVAFLLAPYLRKFGRYTIPDFLGARYGGHAARIIGLIAAVLCSFTYVVAQIYGVGLITTRLTGVQFEIGIFLGLGGILMCSFLGGMKAVTWTQVAQFIVLMAAYLVPVVWLSIKDTGSPVPQLAYGKVLEQISAKENRLLDDPKEAAVRAIFRQRADDANAKVSGLPGSLATERAKLEAVLARLRAQNAPLAEIQKASRALADFPRTVDEARTRWTKDAAIAARAAPPLRQAEPYPGKDEATRDAARRNFLALVFCLMVGTAGLPHLLTRSYTTPTVREARSSVFWSLFFIFLIYFTAPALAVLVKYEIYTHIVGLDYAHLPAWVSAWSKVDPALLSIVDVNRDGVVQLAEIVIGSDVVVLATPEIAGMPYVISGLVAAGGLAAALSTADGLLLTIANALSHDFYYKVLAPDAPPTRRVTISKVLLLIVALLAAVVANKRPDDIVLLVAAAFSLAAAAFFPALVLGIFWRRANKQGAVAGMLAGLGVTLYYMAQTHPWLYQAVHGVAATPEHLAANTWFDIQPIAAGVFGVPLGFAVIAVVSLLTPPPDASTQALIDSIRVPVGTSPGALP